MLPQVSPQLRDAAKKKILQEEREARKTQVFIFQSKIFKEWVDSMSQFERDLFYPCGILLEEKLPIILLTLPNWFLHIQVHLSISGWTDRFLNAQSGSSKMMYYSNLFPVKWKKKNGSVMHH